MGGLFPIAPARWFTRLIFNHNVNAVSGSPVKPAFLTSQVKDEPKDSSLESLGSPQEVCLLVVGCDKLS